MNITTERTFEDALMLALTERGGGYTAGNALDFSRELGLFKYDVIAFLQRTQPTQWDRLVAIHGEDTHNRVIQRLYKELDLRGCLDVLRNGFTDHSIRFQMAFFKPASGLNPESIALYEKNSLKVSSDFLQ